MPKQWFAFQSVIISLTPEGHTLNMVLNRLRPLFSILVPDSSGFWAFLAPRFFSLCNNLKATTGVPEAHLGHACKPCFIAAIPSQTHGNHYLFPYVCDGIAAVKQGLQAWLRWASQTPHGGLNDSLASWNVCSVVTFIEGTYRKLIKHVQ